MTDLSSPIWNETQTQSRKSRRWLPDSAGGWWLAFLGIVFALLGLPLLAGGLWLIGLGGSLYYAIAGLGLIISGVLIARRSITGFWVYALTWLFTMVWAFWEVGLSLWPLVPRTVAPTVLMIALILSLPAFKQRKIGTGDKTMTAFGLGVATLMAFSLLPNERVLAQDANAENAPAINQQKLEAPAGSAVGSAQGSEENVNGEAKFAASAQPLQTGKVGKDWPQYGGTMDAKRYSPLGQINTDNVGKLQQVWLAHTGDMPSGKTEGKYSPENTPIEVDGHLYACSAMDKIISYDAKTGEKEWAFDPKISPDSIPYGATCRGLSYFEASNAGDDQSCARRIVMATLDARLIEVDALSGELCAGFGNKGEIDLEKGIGQSEPGWYAVTAPPAIVRGIIVTGAQVLDGQAEDAPSGVVRGFDAVTGELAWAWDLGRPGKTGAPEDGEVYTRGTPNMWTAAAADEQLGFVYLPLGNSAVDYYGGNRSEEENEYASSLVAVDVTTGEPVWHFQTVHYDLWDYDLGSQPTLVDFPAKDGEGTVPALILPSKQGEIYVLNRRTGEPLFPVEEKPVPSGGVEPENLSETQPFSGYAHLTKSRLQEKDMWGATPIDQLWCRIQFRQAEYEGEYTPPTVDQRYIQYPGYNGGSDWGSVAVDPERGILIANYNDVPNYNKLVTREEAQKMGLRPIDEGGNKKKFAGEGGAQGGSPYAIVVNAGWRNTATGMPCVEPPYGWIRAMDLKTGETLWDKPFGSAEENGPFGIPSMLPIDIGTPNNGGPLVTAGGLIFIAATTDQKFRAYDIETGKVVWETDLPAGGQANPMTYEVDGRQYVVLAPGGHHFMETPVGDEIVAYALPEGS